MGSSLEKIVARTGPFLQLSAGLLFLMIAFIAVGDSRSWFYLIAAILIGYPLIQLFLRPVHTDDVFARTEPDALGKIWSLNFSSLAGELSRNAYKQLIKATTPLDAIRILGTMREDDEPLSHERTSVIQSAFRAQETYITLRAKAALIARDNLQQLMFICYFLAFAGFFALLVLHFFLQMTSYDYDQRTATGGGVGVVESQQELISESDPESGAWVENGYHSASTVLRGCSLTPRVTGLPSFLLTDEKMAEEVSKLRQGVSELDCSRGTQWVFNFGGTVIPQCGANGSCGKAETLPASVSPMQAIEKTVLEQDYCQRYQEDSKTRKECMKIVKEHESSINKINAPDSLAVSRTSSVFDQLELVRYYSDSISLRLAILKEEIGFMELDRDEALVALQEAASTRNYESVRKDFEKLNDKLKTLKSKEARFEAYLEAYHERRENLVSQTTEINFVDGHKISGGLVIPYYFVLLALFGGVVGFARRIPEYQRRAIDGFNVEDDLDSSALDPREAREYLIFQVVQLFSAPFIACFAYSLILPEQFATSAILGFASGFSAEPLLLLIRNAVDRLTGTRDA